MIPVVRTRFRASAAHARPAWRRACRGVLGRRGVTSLEFAAAAGTLMLLLLASMEASFQLATGMALEWGAGRASRFGMTGAAAPRGAEATDRPPCRSASIPLIVTQSTAGFLRASDLTVETRAFPDMAQAQTGAAGDPGAGTGGQVVRYTFAYRRPFLTPVATLITGRAEHIHRVELLVQNEPFLDATC